MLVQFKKKSILESTISIPRLMSEILSHSAKDLKYHVRKHIQFFFLMHIEIRIKHIVTIMQKKERFWKVFTTVKRLIHSFKRQGK